MADGMTESSYGDSISARAISPVRTRFYGKSAARHVSNGTKPTRNGTTQREHQPQTHLVSTIRQVLSGFVQVNDVRAVHRELFTLVKYRHPGRRGTPSPQGYPSHTHCMRLAGVPRAVHGRTPLVGRCRTWRTRRRSRGCPAASATTLQSCQCPARGRTARGTAVDKKGVIRLHDQSSQCSVTLRQLDTQTHNHL